MEGPLVRIPHVNADEAAPLLGGGEGRGQGDIEVKEVLTALGGALEFTHAGVENCVSLMRC
jgi:hypothetical protein